MADPAKPEDFEAELNEVCPVHGFRRLGKMVEIQYIGQTSPKIAKLGQLLEIYNARESTRKLRLSQLRQVGLWLKRGCEES